MIILVRNDTGVLSDKASGKFAGETIYDDKNPDQIETLPDFELALPSKPIQVDWLKAYQN